MNNETTNTQPSNRTGLWIKDSKSGNNYIGGNLKIGGVEYSIRIFKNTKKERPNQPDYTLFYDLKEDKQSNANQPKQVELTDEDYDKALESKEIQQEKLELPF